MNGIPLNIDWQQILLHLMNFVILAGGLYFLLYKPIQKFLAAREKSYSDREAELERRETEAETLKTTYEEKLRDAEAELAARREQIERDAEKEAAQTVQTAQAQAKAIMERAGKVSENRRAQSAEDDNRRIGALAFEAVKRLVLTDGEQALDRFLDAAEQEQHHER